MKSKATHSWLHIAQTYPKSKEGFWIPRRMVPLSKTTWIYGDLQVSRLFNSIRSNHPIHFLHIFTLPEILHPRYHSVGITPTTINKVGAFVFGDPSSAHLRSSTCMLVCSPRAHSTHMGLLVVFVRSKRI